MSVFSLMDPCLEEKLLRVALEVACQQGRRTATAVAAAVVGALRRPEAAEPAGAHLETVHVGLQAGGAARDSGPKWHRRGVDSLGSKPVPA